MYVYDAPIATPLVGTDKHIGACAWSYIPLSTADGTPTIEGTLNLISGALNLKNLTVLLSLNATGRTDVRGGLRRMRRRQMANDGVRERQVRSRHTPGCCGRPQRGGSPRGSERRPRHAMRREPHRNDFGVYDGSYSMDCSPTVVSSLGALSLGGSFSSSGVQVVLTDQSPDCTAPGFVGKKCFCGMCKGEAKAKACMSNADCPGGGPCMGESMPDDEENKANVRAASNLCDNGTCTNWDANEGAGTCVASVLGTPEMPIPWSAAIHLH